jgi:transglutaminase-like putative cysteine protease
MDLHPWSSAKADKKEIAPIIFFPQGFPEPSTEFLRSTEFLDFETSVVREFAEETTREAQTKTERAVQLFYRIRDSIRYDPYRISLGREIYRASHVLSVRAGFCLPKANLLAACARALGIHSAIGLSNVVNHLCTERLRRAMGGTELFIHHGYALLYLDGRWVKAAPAFNIELCEKFDVIPTEFDGKSDALLQPLDARGRRHMEYVVNHGVWSDFPYERVVRDFKEFYPESLFQLSRDTARFEDDLKLE